MGIGDFFHAIGDFFQEKGADANAVPGTFNQAQAQGALNEQQLLAQSPTMKRFGVNFVGAAPSNFSHVLFEPEYLAKDAVQAVAYPVQKADQGITTVALHGQGLTWDQAWSATQASGTDINGAHVANVNIGQVMYEGLRRSPFSTRTHSLNLDQGQNAAQLVQDSQNTWTGKILSGGLDTLVTWYADPTFGLGKATHLARAASEIKTVGEAEEATKAAHDINEGITSGQSLNSISRINPLGKTGLFSQSMLESGQRIFRAVIKTDNLRVADSPELQTLLARTPNSAPIMSLFDAAGQIHDLDLQRQVKIDILGAAQGVGSSMERLIQTAPDIARAAQRISEAPEGREAFDAIHDAVSALTGGHTPANLEAFGQSFIDAANSFKTAGNDAELEALRPHIENVHSMLEGLALFGDTTPLETAGTTALQRIKASWRGAVAQGVYYQSSPSGVGVQVMHWLSTQHFRGQVNTANALMGHQQLMDYMNRAKLFSGAEKRQWSQSFLTAGTQSARLEIADKVQDFVTAKVGAKFGADEATVRRVVQKYQKSVKSGRQFGTQELIAAQQEGRDQMFLRTPDARLASISTPLYETHIGDNAHLMDPSEIHDLYEGEKNGTLSAGQLTGEVLNDAFTKFTNGADLYNHIWRLGVLGRPGLLLRTQFDTQGRNLMMMGATGVLASAMRGVGHLPGRLFKSSDQLVAVDGMAQDLHEAKKLRDTAASLRIEADADEKLGAPSWDYEVPTVQARADRLSGNAATKPTGTADSLAYSSPAAKRQRADALEAQAETLENTEYWAYKYKQGALPRVLNLGKGRTVTTRAYESAVDQDNIVNGALYTEGAHKGEALMGVQGQGQNGMTAVNMARGGLLTRQLNRNLSQLVEDAGNYLTYNPQDALWSAAWVRKTDVMRNTATGRHLLRAGSTPTPDLAKILRTDPEVLDEFKAAHMIGENLDEWLQRSVNDVMLMAPTEDIRKAIVGGKRLTPAQVEDLFAKPTLDSDGKVISLEDGTGRPNRMHVEGPMLSPMRAAKKAGLYVAPNLPTKFVSLLSDKPDQIWGRHPLYVHQYFKHMRDMATRELDRSGDTALTVEQQARLERVAKHRAIQDVQQTMYNTAKYTGAMSSMRFLSPFMGAWQDAMESWTRLFYEDPARMGAFSKSWNIPNRMGLVVDQDGRPVPPGAQANQSFVVLPLSWDNNFKTSRKWTARKDGFNSIFQGAQWYTPGFGPLVQFPAQELVARIHPELGDSQNPIIQSVLPFGTPKTSTGGKGGFLAGLGEDFLNQSLPAWFRTIYNPSDNAQAYLDAGNQAIMDARVAGKPLPTAAELHKIASSATRSGQIIRALSLGLIGVSGQSTNLADFYRRQYNLIYSQNPTNATSIFNQKYPEAKDLSWNLTKSETGIQATVQAWQAEQKYMSEIRNNPTYGWFYVGNANVGGQFSQSVYNTQSSRSVDINGTIERSLQNPQALLTNSLTEDGWAKYQQFMTVVNNRLADLGLHSLAQSQAGQLADQRSAFIAELSKENPAWAADFNSNQTNKIQAFIDNVAVPAVSDPKLKDRSDMQDLAQYLDLRTAVMAKLSSLGVKSLNAHAAAGLREILNEAGTRLAQDNFGFQQVWSRMLMNETLPTQAELLTAQEGKAG